MNDGNEIDLGMALLKARINRLAGTDRRDPREERPEGRGHSGQRASAVVYILSAFRRRRRRGDPQDPTTV